MIFSWLVSFWTRAHSNQHIASNKLFVTFKFQQRTFEWHLRKFERPRWTFERQIKVKVKVKKKKVRIVTIKSRVKGHHVNNYNYTSGEELECKHKVQYTLMLSWYWRRRKAKSEKEKQAKYRLKSGLRLVVFQTLWSKYCFDLWKPGKFIWRKQHFLKTIVLH